MKYRIVQRTNNSAGGSLQLDGKVAVDPTEDKALIRRLCDTMNEHSRNLYGDAFRFEIEALETPRDLALAEGRVWEVYATDPNGREHSCGYVDSPDGAAERVNIKEIDAMRNGSAERFAYRRISSTQPLTIAEAAKVIGCSERNIRRAIQAGALPARKHGRDWIVSHDDALAYKRNPPLPGRPKKSPEIPSETP